MNRLSIELLRGLLEEAEIPRKEIVGMFGGGFKPPTVGHLEVVKRALDENPQMDRMIVLVGSGERDSITQEESLTIWRIYQKYLPKKVEIQPAPEGKPPIGAIYNYGSDNPDKEIYWFVGAREGNEDDLQDIMKRTKAIRSGKYPNIKVKEILTSGGVSGTKARQALLARDKDTFIQFLPDIPEVDQIWNMLSDTMGINEEQNPVKTNDKFLAKKGAYVYSEGKKLFLKRRKFYEVKEIIEDRYNLEDKQGRQCWISKADLDNKWTKYNPEELKKGIEVEKEHTDDPRIAMKIALDHLDEDPQYYTKLATLGLEEVIAHKMGNEDWNNVGNALRDPKKAKAIYGLLLQMFPKQKEIINYNYKNDAFAEMKRIIHGIDKYKLVGPVVVQPKEMKLTPEVEAEREKKFQQFIKGEIDKYFRTDKTDPRKVDVSKFPPITMDEEGFVSDGNHRAFIAKKQNKPLKAYRYIAAKNDHPNVAKILKLVGRSLEERVSFNADFITKDDVEFVDDMADRKLAPIQVDLSGNHFFDRLNDPRNFPDISIEELEEFFDKLADEKDEFIAFLKKYKDVVVKDTDTNINIPFMKLANKAIAKTIMRKKDFKTPNVILPLEEGRYDREVTMISQMIINFFKDTFGKEVEEMFEDAGELEGVKEWETYDLSVYFYPSDFETLGPIPFIVNAAGDEDGIHVQINYRPELFPEAYNELIPELKDAIRHELEHTAQYRFNKDAIPTDTEKQDDLPLVDYLTLDYEIPAFVQGLYKKAKTKKIPFTDALDEFLEEREDQLSPQEIRKVRQTYIAYAKKNLPAAQINEADPKKGTGKKPKGSGRRLYTDEDPSDTVGIKFKTKEDIVDTLNKASFKNKSHARQSQVINLIHQRVRAAYGKAKDPDVKSRLKRGLDYITDRKEASKEKTKRLQAQKEHLNENLEGNIQSYIDSLTDYMNGNGLTLKPYPSVEFVEDNKENAANIFGKTAYYMPSEKKIVLFTLDRHPKDVLRSYAHELVHHHQNLNGTLENYQTTNTNEDGDLDRIEREAYENGNILFRNWEDSIKNQ